ncbi:acyltransferase family protein [Flavobacteriaceae bacterium S0862]|nr:acyltransferase family protein [Flavobacteriaceae bacterium S0862]
MKENQLGIAFLRVLATFSVIVIHVSAPILGEYGNISLFDWNLGNAFDSSNRYSVPMFFMISGALLLNKDYTLKEFFKKRFIKILPPFIFWSLVYSIYKRFVIGNEQSGVLDSVDKITRDIFYGSEYHLWFVFVLLGIYLLTPIIRKWVKQASSKEVAFFLSIWLFTIVYRIPGLSIYFPKVELMYFSGYLGYFVLGYYLLNVDFKNKFIPISSIVLGILITSVGTYYFTEKNNKLFSYFYEFLSINALMVATGVFLLFKNFSTKNETLKHTFVTLSSCCFGIYLVHVLILELLELYGFYWSMFTPIVSVPLVSFLCFILSFASIYFIKKVKYGKLITG